MECRGEVTGGVDLINHCKLKPQYDYFCKKSLPLSISDSHYLHNVVGDTEIKTGAGMQLDQLIKDGSSNVRIQPFELGVLGEAFQLRESGPIDLPISERGIPTIPGKSKSGSKDKDKKHKKHRNKGKDKERDKEHKHRHKDRSKDIDKEKKKDKSGHHEKKRKHDGDGGASDIHKHNKNKH